MGAPVKPTLNGSIPIGLTGVTKLCLSSVSFRRSTGVYKSDSIGSTGERNPVLTCQSTGDISVQPAYTKVISSDQPAFRCRSGGVSGKLHRRNQPVFKPYASDRPVLKKIAGLTCHICVLPADACLSPLVFPNSAPPPLNPPLQRHRYTSPPPVHAVFHAAARLHTTSTRHRAAAPSAPPARVAAAAAPRPRRCLRIASPPLQNRAATT